MTRRKWRYGGFWNENNFNDWTYQNSLQVTIEEAKEILEAMLYRNADIENPDYDMFTLKQVKAIRKVLSII